MPIHLDSSNRREFLTTVGGGVLAASAGIATADIRNLPDTDPDLVYILNDTHIGEKHPADSPVPTHLRQVVKEITERKRKPAAVVINGDLALKDGQPGDYRHFAKLIAPLREAKVKTYLTLGNHDHREVFYKILKDEKPEDPPVVSRHISIIKTRNANFFLLDSLIKTMTTQGEVGEAQLTWLTQALDAMKDKPAIIVAHHNPRLGGDPLHFPGGLIDSKVLWHQLSRRRHVKAYIHGHIHDRGFAEHQGIHIINTVATSYVADRKTSTTGWTTADLTPRGVKLITHTNIPNHPWNGLSQRLLWRT